MKQISSELYNTWIIALKSGLYKPHKNSVNLRIGDCYSPLGVLADISGIGDWIKQQNNGNYWGYRIGDYAWQTLLPVHAVFKRLGIDEVITEFASDHIFDTFDDFVDALERHQVRKKGT